MHGSKFVIGGALVMLIAACGSKAPSAKDAGGSNAANSSTANASAPAAQASTPATTPPPNLTAELLAARDLPANRTAVGSSDAGEPKCLDNVRADLNAVSKAEATFTYGNTGLPAVEQYLAYVPGRGQSAMTVTSRLLSGCGQVSIATGGVTFSGTVGSMPFPAVADHSFAYQMPLSGTSSGQSVTIDIDIVVFRKADTVAIILYANVDTAGVQALQSIARAAAAKLS